jgi:hypothetical protein
MRVVPATYQEDIAPHAEAAHAEGFVDVSDAPTRQWLKLVNGSDEMLGCVAINRSLPRKAWCDGLYIPPKHRGKGYVKILVADARERVVQDLSLDWFLCTIVAKRGHKTPLDKYDQVIISAPLSNGDKRLTTVRNMKAFRQKEK